MITNHRIVALQQKLEEQQLDGAVYATSASLQYLLDDTTFYWQRSMETGIYVFPGTPLYSTEMSYFHCKPDILLWVPKCGKATVIATYARASTMPNTKADITCHYVMFGANLADSIGNVKKIGIGLSCFTAIKAMITMEADPSIECIQAENLVEELRMCKEPKEIEAMRKVAAFTDECMGKICDLLRPGVTQWEIENKLNQLGIDGGCEDIPFSPSCTFTKTGDPRCAEKVG